MTRAGTEPVRPSRAALPVGLLTIVCMVATTNLINDQFPNLSPAEAFGMGSFVTSWLLMIFAVILTFFGGIQHALDVRVSPKFAMIAACAITAVAIPFLGFVAIILEVVMTR